MVKHVLEILCCEQRKIFSVFQFLHNMKMLVNPFHATRLFRYALKTSENLKVFWCFQGVSKWASGMKWVNTYPPALSAKSNVDKFIL